METSSQTITSTTIIISILSSSLITAALTKIVEFYFNKINYKKDYYKIILDRRLNSYETLLNLLFESGNMSMDEDNSPYSTAFENSEMTTSYFRRFWSIQYHGMWFSKTVADDYNALLVYLNDSMNDYFINNRSSDEECIRFAKNIYKKQIILARKLHYSLMSDMKSLHDTDKFFSEELHLGN